MDKDLTQGSIAKTLARFSFPFFLSYFLQTLYGMADLFIIGQFDGTASTTAVSIGSQIMHVITVIIVGLAMGSTVTIGQSVGKGDKEEASKAIGNSFILFIFIALVLTVILISRRDFIIGFLSTPVTAIPGTMSYLTICFIGIPFITVYNIISSFLRATGDSKSPLYFILVACIANIALDYIFIGGLRLGPLGAALGTTLSQSLSVFISLYVIKRKDTGLWFKKKFFAPDPLIMKRILKIGVPVGLQDGFIQVSFIVLTILANMRGLTDAAACGVVEKIISIFFIVPSSMLQSLSVLVAQNTGAGQDSRALSFLKYSCLVACSFGIIASVLVFLDAESLIGMFSSDAAVVISGSNYIRGYISDSIFAGFHFSMSGYFCGRGHSAISFIHNTLSMLLVRIPLAFFGATHFRDTLLPMGLASPAGSLFSCIICIIFFIRIQKKYNRI